MYLKSSLTFLASLFLSLAAHADNEISIRVVQFENYRIGIAEDSRVFGIQCSGGWVRDYQAAIYIQNADGDLLMDPRLGFRTAMSAPRSPHRSVSRGVATLCGNGNGIYKLADQGKSFAVTEFRPLESAEYP